VADELLPEVGQIEFTKLSPDPTTWQDYDRATA
jgi:hypothetical protein